MITIPYSPSFTLETKQKTPKKRKHFSVTMYLHRAKWDNKIVYTLQITLLFLGAICFTSCHSDMYYEEVHRYWYRSHAGDSCDTKIEELIHMDDEEARRLYLLHEKNGTLYTPHS